MNVPLIAILYWLLKVYYLILFLDSHAKLYIHTVNQDRFTYSAASQFLVHNPALCLPILCVFLFKTFCLGMQIVASNVLLWAVAGVYGAMTKLKCLKAANSSSKKAHWSTWWTLKDVLILGMPWPYMWKDGSSLAADILMPQTNIGTCMMRG